MKTITATLLAAALLTVGGCSALKPKLVDEDVQILRPAQTNQVALVSVSTNVVKLHDVVTDVVTNANGRPMVLSVTNVTYATNLATVTNYHTVIVPEIAVTNQSLSGSSQAIINGAQRVAGATGIPFLGEIIGLLGAGASGFLTWTNRRNKRKALDAMAAAEGKQMEVNSLEKARRVAQDSVYVLSSGIDEVLAVARQLDGFTPKHEEQIKVNLQRAQKLLNVHDHIAKARKSGRLDNGKS